MEREKGREGRRRRRRGRKGGLTVQNINRFFFVLSLFMFSNEIFFFIFFLVLINVKKQVKVITSIETKRPSLFFVFFLFDFFLDTIGLWLLAFSRLQFHSIISVRMSKVSICRLSVFLFVYYRFRAGRYRLLFCLGRLVCKLLKGFEGEMVMERRE